MSDDLRYLFARLRADAQQPVLPEPTSPRAEGQRRQRVRRGIAGVSIVVLLSGGGLGAHALGWWRYPSSGPGPGTSAAVEPTTPDSEHRAPPAVSSSPSLSPTSTTGLPSRAPGADCRPGDLDPRPYYGDGAAAGTRYRTIVVQNISATVCRLDGHPTVRYVDPATTGGMATVALTRQLDATPVNLSPGDFAKVTISAANGNPYGPGSPQCAQPHEYQQLSLIVGDDLPFALKGFTLAWECGEGYITAWEPAPGGPGDAGESATRAPA